MPLWTDLIDPVEATGIARDEQDVVERERGGTLARFLPNVLVESDHVRFRQDSFGLTDVARYRAFNARPEVGKGPGAKSSVVDLPAISRTEPIDEMTQKELRRATDDRVRRGVEAAIKRNVRAISMRQELARGAVIKTGKLVVDEDNFWINDDFGRNAALTVVAGAGQWWADPAIDRLAALSTWGDLYALYNNGLRPGRMVFGSSTAANAFAAGNQFRTNVGSAYRPPMGTELASYAAGAGLPEYEVYERRVQVEGTLTAILDPKCVYFLPEPVDPFSEDGALLGATYWGLTESATFQSWGIEPDEQPGIVCGIYRDEKVGMSIECEGDAIGEPIAVNADAAMSIQVLV